MDFILFGRRIRMARPRLLDRIADRDQGVPPALVVDGSHPVELRKPARNLGPRPKPAIVRWRLDPLLESRQRLGRQDGRLGSIVDTLVAERLGTALVVAFE